jgi:hypothetical protein
VVHLEDEEGDDPEENLRLRHDSQRIGGRRERAMGRAAQIVRSSVLVDTGRSDPWRGRSVPSCVRLDA